MGVTAVRAGGWVFLHIVENVETEACSLCVFIHGVAQPVAINKKADLLYCGTCARSDMEASGSAAMRGAR